MDVNVVRGCVTIVSMAAFLGVCWWAYRPANRERLDRDALLPFLDDAEASDSSLRETER